MQRNFKKAVAFIMCLALVMPIQSNIVLNAEEISAEETTDTYEADAVDEDFVSRTEKEVLSQMTLACENDNFKFYYKFDDDDELIALVNKENDYIWWSSPINAKGDPSATNTIRQELSSGIVVTYGDLSSRSTSNLRSGKNGKISVKEVTDGIKVTYSFKSAGISVPVEYVLCDDYLKATVVTSEIEEDDPEAEDAKVVTSVTLCNAFGAADTTETGYFVIPDGSGALINFNNGKTSAKTYSGTVYGSDISAVSNLKPSVTEQVYLPVYGIVKDGNTLTVIADEGDANVSINASVSGQSKSSYNTCKFTFTLRGIDTFYMGGLSNPLTVFEQGEIKTKTISVRYYPTAAKDASYFDVAECYRNYLETEKGVTKKTEENSSPLYIDIYGGVEKETPVLGVPMTLKTAVTTFNQTEEILQELIDSGTDNLVVSLNNWSNAGIEGSADYKAKPASVLGGNGDFKDLLEFFDDNSISYYPVVNNKTFVSGNGYHTFKDTNIRVSGSYSRILDYEDAFGTPQNSSDSLSLLSPSAFSDIYESLVKNFSKKGLTGVSIGEMTSTLYGDYGKKSISRQGTQQIIEESLESLSSGVGSVLAQTANAYALSYVDHITNVPVTSSGYDIFDADIPFYQMVIHGLIPYSTTAVNGSADTKNLIMMAVATGSSLHFDMIYEETSILKDTEYDNYYYANYANWLDTAAKEYKFVNDIIESVSDKKMISYTHQLSLITTVYEDGTEITVDFYNGVITCNGTEYILDEYAQEEGLIF